MMVNQNNTGPVSSAGEAVVVEVYVHREGNRYLASALLPIDTPLRPGLNKLYAAPQSSATTKESLKVAPQSSATTKESLKVAPQVTLEQAREIVKDRSNGTLSGISSGKGGRAWLDGEWQLCELEALCVMIRAEAGDHAEGAAELIEYWKDVEGE
ncbi:hypothetical protein AchV4_0044 [Achromobacter phage vB_AchrS_AchV4]|uniref:Uncharacterized protein n=1 Tax=Achromobacter phage vB_AchrS_AchV4 TaxID=2796514 RepID=A0A7T3PGW8_9CAUD|nr:hypothetical protein JT316_gp44 [Achromobacter phage vB_AchrS_AchV4]QPZ53273.1 hypothetical protein AchV4_0044 [Achromobacter phage vB_AchrS_AchV4]